MRDSRPLLEISRRFLLRAAGGSLVLPFLATRGARAQASPKRFVVFHVTEGVPNNDTGGSGDFWWPSADLSSFPAASAPMAKHRSRLLFVKGFRQNRDAASRHTSGMEDMLTGDKNGAPERIANGMRVPGGTSLDVILGKHMKGRLFETYGLGVLSHRITGPIAWGRITYAGPNGGRDPVNNPLRAFDDLLGGKAGVGGAGNNDFARRVKLQQSVLSSLKGELARLRCGLGTDGRRKLDAYTSSIRDIELRLAQQMGATATGPTALSRPVAQGERSFWNEFDRCPEVADLQMRIGVAALAAGSTRVLTFLWGASVCNQTYGFLRSRDIPRPGERGHGWAHGPSQGRRQDIQARVVIYRWYSEQFVKLLDLLASTPGEDGAPLLDSTAVMYCSEMAHGNHGAGPLPFILAGSAGGRFKQGTTVNVGALRPLNEMLTGVAQGFGLELSGIGKPQNSQRPCTDILA